MTEAYIALGSNLGNSPLLLEQALELMDQLPATQLLTHSRFYQNPPLGPTQPDYLNAVARIETTLQPIQLLNRLQGIERRLGRVRNGKRWGARSLDLDLLLYGSRILRHPRLQVPHIGLGERGFVVLPLAEVAPEDLRIPGNGFLRDLIPLFDPRGLTPLERRNSVD